jgi:drug/metabolite transporter (DMT)-like permease
MCSAPAATIPVVSRNLHTSMSDVTIRVIEANQMIYLSSMKSGALVIGVLSAALFGVATPLSKMLLESLSQFQLAGLLYLGAGLGMLPLVAVQWRRFGRRRLDTKNALQLAAAVLFGGCLGPVFLLLGLKSAQASSVSLWLNLELAATAVLGFLFFRDHLDLSGWLGIGGALLAGVLVTIGEGSAGIIPSLFVALACVCWGLDNNLAALIDRLTPQEITFVKGIIAGVVNLCIGMVTIGRLPALGIGVASLFMGAVCYGGSIALFITAAQRMGAARGQILFASAPFFGLLFSIILLSERISWPQAVAAAVLLASIALMLRGRHSHRHQHTPTVHIHAHRHDDMHHAHTHAEAPAGLMHLHEHTHDSLQHEHVHVPDLHHRHTHGKLGF